MLSKIISKARQKQIEKVEELTLEYWEDNTNPEIKNKVKEFWNKLYQFRSEIFDIETIVSMKDMDKLNALFAEHVMGWTWTNETLVFAEDFVKNNNPLKDTPVATVTHWQHNGSPISPVDFTSDQYAVKIMNRLRNQGILYALKPTQDGYAIYSQMHDVTFEGKTLGEVVCKLALITTLYK